MLYSDPVTFYSMLAECRTMEYAQTSTWVLLQPADLLFEHAKNLIFNKNLGNQRILFISSNSSCSYDTINSLCLIFRA